MYTRWLQPPTRERQRETDGLLVMPAPANSTPRLPPRLPCCPTPEPCSHSTQSLTLSLSSRASPSFPPLPTSPLTPRLLLPHSARSLPEPSVLFPGQLLSLHLQTPHALKLVRAVLQVRTPWPCPRRSPPTPLTPAPSTGLVRLTSVPGPRHRLRPAQGRQCYPGRRSGVGPSRGRAWLRRR